MSNLNVGQLTASFDVDPSGAEAGITQAELAMHGLQRDAQQTATRIRSDFNAALRRLPTVRLDANSTPLDHALQAARQNLRDLAAERVGITISTDEARTRLASLQTELEAINRERPSPEIAVQVGQAYEVLESLQLRLDTMAREDVAVRVHVDAERAREQLARVQQDSRDAGQSMGREVEGGSNRASRALTSLAGVFGQVVSVAFSSGSMMGIGISSSVSSLA